MYIAKVQKILIDIISYIDKIQCLSTFVTKLYNYGY